MMLCRVLGSSWGAGGEVSHLLAEQPWSYTAASCGSLSQLQLYNKHTQCWHSQVLTWDRQFGKKY